MKRKRSTTLIGVTVIVALAGWLVVNMLSSAGSGSALAIDAADAAGGKPTPVEVTQPARRPLVRRLTMPATLQAGDQADLYAKTSGYVAQMNVDIGSRVEKDQTLLTISVPEMADELRRAEAILEARKARAVQAGSVVETARAEVQRAEAEHELSRLNFDRSRALREGNAIPQQELDDARSKLAIAGALVKIAQARVTSAQADVTVADSEVAVAEANVSRFKTLMGYATIRAPFAGVITRRIVDPGAFVRSAAEGTTTPLLTLARVDSIRLVLEIPESDAPHVRAGSAVEIDIKAIGGKPIEAEVTRSAMALNPDTRTMRVEVDLPNPDGRLAPGMFARVTIKLETKQRALMIPSKAIRVRGRKVSVLVVNGDRAESRPVEIGYDDGIWVEITGGNLTVDDRIIVASGGTVMPGDAVRPSLIDVPKS